MESQIPKMRRFSELAATVVPMRRQAASHFMTEIPKPLPRANAGLAFDVADAFAALHVPEIPEEAAVYMQSIIDRADEAGTGVPVSAASKMLRVSERTVRIWINKHVLATLENAHPVLIRPRSLGEAIRAAAVLRSLGNKDSRLLRYWSEQREFGDLASRLRDIEDRRELDLDNLESELFS
jgi:hypothetical protein